MEIGEIIWPQDRIEHIALHGVEPREVEEVCFGQPLILRAKSKGVNPVYYALGQTDLGSISALCGYTISGWMRISGYGPRYDKQRKKPI